MTGIRARLENALRLHEPVEDGEGFFCSCSSTAVLLEQGIATDHTPSHLADVLLSLPGIAIVELPAQCIPPTWWSDDCLGAWRGPSGEDPVSAWHRTGSESIALPSGDFISSAHARTLAAALLAAANTAEVAPVSAEEPT